MTDERIRVNGVLLPTWLIPPTSWVNRTNPAPSADPCGKAEEAPHPRKAGKREPAVWRPMTDLEKRAAAGLGHCRFPPGTSTKRLARHLAEQAGRTEPIITDKQAVYLWRFAWTYRRQIGDAGVTREAKRRRETETGGLTDGRPGTDAANLR